MTFIEHQFQQSTKCLLNNTLHDAFYYLIFNLKTSSNFNTPYDSHGTLIPTINQVLLKWPSS
jgi:hypothetical protein